MYALAVPDEPPAVPADLQAAIEGAADSVKGDPDSSRKLEFLIDALIMRGQLPERFKTVIARIQADRSPRVHLAVHDNKYEIESRDIDCAARIPLCGARCCGFKVALSEQDVREGKVPFVIDRPYELPRDPETKLCTCMNAEGACTIYEVRPGTCRTYDCTEDRRVWIDFENRIPAPMPER